MTEKNGAKEKIMNEPVVRIWCIGPDGTEYFAAHSRKELIKMYIEMVGREQQEEDFAAHCEEVPQSCLDDEFDWTDEEGRKVKTTWRKQIECALIPGQISTSYN